MEDLSTLENLDLEERRRRNIERNQKYFAQLFATLSQVNNVLPTPKKQKYEGLEQSDQKKETEEDLENLTALFPSFKEQVYRISSFMDALMLKEHSEAIPMLWLGGSLPPYEKKEILFSLLKIKSIVPVHINFEGIEGFSELLKILTSRLFDSLNFFSELNKFHLQYSQFRGIFSNNKTLPDFCKNLGFLQEELDKNESSRINLSIVFIFENIAAWGAKIFLDSDFRQAFPKLSKWRKLGLIYIQQYPIVSSKNHLSRSEDVQITFQAYSEGEMKKFIFQKLQKFLTDIFPDFPNNSCPFQTQCSLIFKKILEIIPICMSCGITSRDELYTMICSLWSRLYNQSLSSSCSAVLTGMDPELIQSKFPEPNAQTLKSHFEELIQQSTFLTSRQQPMQNDTDQVATQLPLKLQYLIISAYLASNNPKSSDDLTFLSEKNKKRKWNKISVNENSKEQAEERTGINGRTFSVERLLSIYAQVLHINEGISTIDYGSPELHSALETLTLRKFLWKSPNWKPSKPMYGGNIRRAVVEEISRSLQFPLEDFLFDSSKMNFKW